MSANENRSGTIARDFATKSHNYGTIEYGPLSCIRC
jgi:hypothetical protein